MSEKVEKLLADSRLAFLNQQNGMALNLAKEAIRLAPKNADAYKCAANAYMSMDRVGDAIAQYNQAVKCDPKNGNRYYDLGFAYATDSKSANAIRAFAKAEELGCVPENLVQLYQVLGIICFDIGRFDDALINLSKAEKLLGVDLDLLQRKAVIYGLKNDIRNGIHTANQIKLVSPSSYTGYQIAFKLLVQAGRLGDAARELDIAKRFANPCMDYYFDAMTLELEHYKSDKNRAHFTAGLELIETALKELTPSAAELIDSYINAAELYLQLENAGQTIACLNAAQNPIDAYNNGFDLIVQDYAPVELSEDSVDLMIEEDREQILNEYGEYGLEELTAYSDPDEEGQYQFLTELPEDLAEEPAKVLPPDTQFELTKENIDQINRLYVGAYTLNNDFESVIRYAKLLQVSENLSNAYIGIYTEVNAMKQLGLPEVAQKYDEVIRFFRGAMIKDPTDLAAVTFRIQCLIDIGEYDEAEQVCNLLSKDARKALLDTIAEAKAGGKQ